MKQYICHCISVFLAGVLLLVLSKPSQAQTNEPAPVYVQVAFMKVPPDGGAEYVSMERELWKPVHEELIKQGIISAWYLFAVRHGDAPYNFVTVNVYNDFAKMENPYPEGIFQKVHGEINMDEAAARTFGSREMVRSEISVLIDGVIAENRGTKIRRSKFHGCHRQHGGVSRS